MILLQLSLIAAATYPARNSVERTVSKAVGKRTGISPPPHCPPPWLPQLCVVLGG